MKVLFLTIANITEIESRGIYKDLLRKFYSEGHDIFVVSPIERRYNKRTNLIVQEKVTILNIKTLNIQKTSIFEKGLSTILIESQFLRGIKKYLDDKSFDLVLYSTPPITFTRVIRHIKNNNNALSYLLLKDIFPQNAVDLQIIRKEGLLYKFFRRKEKNLYAISDYIGCMSPRNAEYICEHNQELDSSKVELNPNSIEPINVSHFVDTTISILENVKIPEDATVFLYGGNLGKPQGIDFLIKVLENQKSNSEVYFIIVGSGTEYSKLNAWFEKVKPTNAILQPNIAQKDYELVLRHCDVGMIFLDHRFTIPNFPVRLLSYLENRIPVLAATDINTDLGDIIVGNEFGLWAEAGDLENIVANITLLLNSPEMRKNMGQNGYKYLLANHTVDISYKAIMDHFH